jgi:hypothetical protein
MSTNNPHPSSYGAMSDEELAAAQAAIAKELVAIRAEQAHRRAKSVIQSKPRIGQTSSREEGEVARREYVRQLSKKGIALVGARKSYRTPDGRRISIAYANELDQPNKWFLGVKDDDPRPSVVVLLCNGPSVRKAVILGPGEIARWWTALSRSRDQVKFHISREGSRYFLEVPGGRHVDLTANVDRDDLIRGP